MSIKNDLSCNLILEPEDEFGSDAYKTKTEVEEWLKNKLK